MGSSVVKSAERTLEILTFLGAQGRPVPAARIAGTLGLPRSSTYHLLNVMKDRGFVMHDPDEFGWAIGLAVRDIVLGHSLRDVLARLGRPLMKRLAEGSRATSLLALDHGQHALVIERVDPVDRHVGNPPTTGMRLPVHLSAYGRAILMHQPPSELRATFPETVELRTVGGHGPRRHDQLVTLLRASAAQGYAGDEEGLHGPLRSLASPVFDHLGYPIASLGVTAWQQDSAAWGNRIIDRVVSTAAVLSARLGYRGSEAETS